MAPTETTPVLAAYLTFPDAATAQAIAKTLVERRLVACVNLLPSATSVYRWEDEVVTATEVIGWAKTTRDRLPALTQAVRELHPYDLPCVVAYPAVGGLSEYLAWVEDEVN